MNKLSLLPWRKSFPATGLRPAPSHDDLGNAAGDETAQGCGWFDSSHELQHGLSIQEHASADTLAGELPLASWLELHLAGWRPAHPPGRRPDAM